MGGMLQPSFKPIFFAKKMLKLVLAMLFFKVWLGLGTKIIQNHLVRARNKIMFWLISGLPDFGSTNTAGYSPIDFFKSPLLVPQRLPPSVPIFTEITPAEASCFVVSRHHQHIQLLLRKSAHAHVIWTCYNFIAEYKCINIQNLQNYRICGSRKCTAPTFYSSEWCLLSSPNVYSTPKRHQS